MPVSCKSTYFKFLMPLHAGLNFKLPSGTKVLARANLNLAGRKAEAYLLQVLLTLPGSQ